MVHDVKTVANCFLAKDFENGKATISPLKIQKLVYCLHGWNLAISGEPLLKDNFCAWPYGPVHEALYYIFSKYGGEPITSYAKTWNDDEEIAYVVSRDDKKFYEIFDAVYEKYIPFTAIRLSSLTHMQDTPWDITRNTKGNSEIDNELIRKHFCALVRRNE